MMDGMDSFIAIVLLSIAIHVIHWVYSAWRPRAEEKTKFFETPRP
jgi:hypothetical protein